MPLNYERPDSFLGLLMGLEGVADASTIIHGPTGCKYYPASLAESFYRFRPGTRGPAARNMLSLPPQYFFTQPRLPCTYLDSGQFVQGAGERLKDLYGKVEKMGPGLIGIVNSPGASLIGEDLTAVGGKIPTVRIDHAAYSGTAGSGFQDAVLAILDAIPPQRTAAKHGVDLVGLSIMHLNWEDTCAELSGLLGRCGIRVNRVLGAGWSTADISQSADAELNVVVHPEYGVRIAQSYQERFGIPYAVSPAGAPLGFDSLETWIKTVCTAVKADPSPALAEIKKGRKRAAATLSVLEAYHLLPRGRTFSVEADGSTLYAVARFLYDYLGMIPVALHSPEGTEWEQRVRDYFTARHIPVGDDPQHTDTDFLVSDQSLVVAAKVRGTALGGFAVESPGPQLVHATAAPALGLEGTLRLLDAVLNTVADRQRFR
ncbi:MAG: nitrogenase component 1 [Methanomethylophilus sp.]|nr:nitrogenase component 1 [Methanomethylophilus sp.]